MKLAALFRCTFRRTIPLTAVAALAVLLGMNAGCSSHGGHPQTTPDGGAAGHGGSGGHGGAKPTDGGSADQVTSTCGVTGPKIETGKSCACDAECSSGHCVEGLCCATACSGGCQTCSAPDSPGTCVMRPAGATPRTTATCPVASPTTCGLDGSCDGAGSCRKYLGNTCMNGTCSGDAVVGAFACDGTGQCKPGVTLMLCIPYTCNPATGSCYSSCDSAAMCQSGGACDFSSESCGQAQNGYPCTADSGCRSGHCVDKVCCNSSCSGACTSCNLPGRLGTCLPVDAGKPDPRALCKDQGAASCGHNGTCDGVGGCSNYTRDTQCLMPSCTGNRLNTAGTCDGLGTCRAPGVQNCHPFRCVDGACTNSCQTDSDCDTGTICQNGTCGPKPLGFTCGGSAECASGFCVDGVCCESACNGTCSYCALATSPGHCLMVAADNVDPRGACQDNGAASCGTNGKCDGTGSCEKYAVGTVCAAEKCDTGLYTGPSTCNPTGQCVAPDARPCAPYVCNGTQCFSTCATDDQCKPPTSCTNNSCGLKVPGAACSANAECLSNFCAQGVCCNSACDGKCQSCALNNSQGTCTNIPAGSVDPTATCTDQGVASCGTNGKCDGNGGCQLYAQGATCQGSTCPAGTTTFTATSTCDGAGKCVTPNASPCFPYQCGTNVCKNSCTVDGDCASPAVCINGSCGLKGNGQACATAAECLSNFCAQGTCCATACQGACQSCGLQNSLGTCTNVPNGTTDPQGTCHDNGNASCGTDGFCDGNGACRLYAGGTSCAPPSCPSTSMTLTSGRTCDGKGSCQPATTIACAPYVCNGTTACKAACASDADCQAPNICDPKTNLCGNKKRLGQACTATIDCLTGNSCVDGVCCSATACPTCQACNVTGSAGNCANVAANTPEPHSLCTPTPPCGNTGACDGAGHCQAGGTSVSCGTASCTGATFTPVSHCNGSGACAAPTSSACPGNFQCGSGTNACLTACASDADCVAPFTCQGSGTTKSCALKPNGQACTTTSQCISGFCTNGVCCGSASCPTCQACNLNGVGSCSNIAAGVTAPSGQCAVTTTCGNTGTCNGAGACTQAAATVVCGTATCTGTTFTPAPTCSGIGTCPAATSTSCGNYVCGTGACKTSCNGDTDCSSGNFCTGAGGTCTALKGNGAACGAAHECGSGNCVDGVCCASSACGTCQACNLNGAGTCANVNSGITDPHARCAPNGTCGNTGTCNGGGACTQAAASVMCVAPSCSNGVATAAAFCTGTGSCATPAMTACTPYLCGTAGCNVSCSADTDCVGGDYCTGAGGSCQTKKPLGTTCASNHECGSSNCVDGVCCSATACGSCQACNVNGLGTCANIAGGQPAPAGQCSVTTTCGFTGTCNGTGGCTLASGGTQCAGPICAANSTFFTPAASCDGAGTCGNPSASNCTPYNCKSTGCPNSCDSDNDCIPTYYCTGAGGTCAPRSSAGIACTGNDQCQSGFCTNGFCCGSATCASCMSCGVPGFEGTCTAVPAGGADPTGSCTGMAAAPTTCGPDGLCDGSGGCQLWPATTICSGVTCPAGTHDQVASFCDGAGTCSNVGVPVAHCSPLMCDGNASCLTTCASDADCAVGTCQAGTCM